MTSSSDTASATRPKSISLGALLPVGLFSVVAGLFLFSLFFGSPGKLPSMLIGKQVPAFTAPTIANVIAADGSVVRGFSDKTLRQGELTLVNVWATWCPSCRVEHPMLMTLKKRLGVQVFGLDHKDKDSTARRYLSVHGNPFDKLGTDKKGRIAIDLGVYGVPETFLVDGDGKVLLRHPGPITESVVRTVLLPAITKANGGVPPRSSAMPNTPADAASPKPSS